MGLQQLRTLSALAEDLVVLLVPSLDGSQQPISSVPGDPTSSAGICGHLQTLVHMISCMHTYTYIQINK